MLRRKADERRGQEAPTDKERKKITIQNSRYSQSAVAAKHPRWRRDKTSHSAEGFVECAPTVIHCVIESTHPPLLFSIYFGSERPPPSQALLNTFRRWLAIPVVEGVCVCVCVCLSPQLSSGMLAAATTQTGGRCFMTLRRTSQGIRRCKMGKEKKGRNKTRDR